MAVRLLDQKLELTAIKGMCGDSKMSSYLFSSLKEDHFKYSAAKELQKRIVKLARTKGSPPDYEELISDPAVSSKARKALEELEAKVPQKKEKAKSLVVRLEDYRKARGLYDQTVQLYKEFTDKDKIDIDELIGRATDSLTKVRLSTNRQRIHHFGKGNNTDKLVENLLIGERALYVPTGLDAWDSINGGIPYGEYFVICATTGGGKSVMAKTILLNQAKMGYRTCFPSGTLVSTPDGPRKIERLKPGDKVQSFNHDNNQVETKTVTATAEKPKKKLLKITYNGGTFICTPDHEIWCEDRQTYVRADELVVGEKLKPLTVTK